MSLEAQMFKLPINTILGDLNLLEVFEHFDFPRIFTCKNKTDQLYLVLSTFDDEDECHWLYLPISRLRLKAVLGGHMAFHAAFREPEDGFLLVVKTFVDHASELTYALPDQVSDDDLPLPNYFLNLSSDHIEDEEIVDPRQVAKASRREAFNYYIYPGEAKHEVGARKLGEILAITQELLDALGQAVDGKPTVRGPLAVELLQKTKVNVSHVFHDSFGVQFRADKYSDLLDHSKISDALVEFGNLLLAGDSEDLLSNKLHSLKGRVASKYSRLLKGLSDLQSGLFLDWGAVHHERGGKFSLTLEQVVKAHAIVDRIDIEMAEEVVVRGKLIGYNSRIQRYEIFSMEDAKNYSGRVADDAEIRVNYPAIGDLYIARLRMLVETQSTSGDELIRWVLIGLSEAPQKI